MSADPRRHVPRTDTLLADPQLAAAGERLGRGAGQGRRPAGAAADPGRRGRPAGRASTPSSPRCPPTASSLRPVLNATGVLVHTNLGRAPLSPARGRGGRRRQRHHRRRARPGHRAPRPARGGARSPRCWPRSRPPRPRSWSTTAPPRSRWSPPRSAQGRELVLARGELVEIGDGFRIPDLLASHRRPAARGRDDQPGHARRLPRRARPATPAPCSRCTRRTSSSAGSPGPSRCGELAAALAGTGVPLVADVGSGLLRPHPLLPDEPDLQTTLAAGADLVLASGDKLLGGPQAGLVLGRRRAGPAAAPASAVPRAAGRQDDAGRARGHAARPAAAGAGDARGRPRRACAPGPVPWPTG